MLTTLALVLFGRFALPPPALSPQVSRPTVMRLHGPPRVSCTLRVLQADPDLDAAIVRAVPRALAGSVDPEMVVRSRCEDPEREFLK